MTHRAGGTALALTTSNAVTVAVHPAGPTAPVRPSAPIPISTPEHRRAGHVHQHGRRTDRRADPARPQGGAAADASRRNINPDANDAVPTPVIGPLGPAAPCPSQP